MKRSPREEEVQRKVDKAFAADPDWEKHEDGSWRLTPEAFERRLRKAHEKSARDPSPIDEARRKIDSLLFDTIRVNETLRDRELHKLAVVLAAVTDERLRDVLYREVRKRKHGAKSYTDAYYAEQLAQVAEDALYRGDSLDRLARLLIAALWHFGTLPAPKLREYDFEDAVAHVVERFERRDLGDFRYVKPEDPRRLAMYYCKDALQALGASKKQADRLFEKSHRMTD